MLSPNGKVLSIKSAHTKFGEESNLLAWGFFVWISSAEDEDGVIVAFTSLSRISGNSDPLLTVHFHKVYQSKVPATDASSGDYKAYELNYRIEQHLT